MPDLYAMTGIELINPYQTAFIVVHGFYAFTLLIQPLTIPCFITCSHPKCSPFTPYSIT